MKHTAREIEQLWSDDGDGRREEGVHERGLRFAGQIETLGKVDSSASSIEATNAAQTGEMIVPGRTISLVL